MSVKTTIQILKEEYLNIMDKVEDVSNSKYRVLQSRALHDHLKKQVLEIEKLRNSAVEDIRIQLRNARIAVKQKRKDTPHLRAYAECSFTKRFIILFLFCLLILKLYRTGAKNNPAFSKYSDKFAYNFYKVPVLPFKNEILKNPSFVILNYNYNKIF